MSEVSSSVAADDAAAIRAILARQKDAWNRHDMDAFVADTIPDVEWINVVGMHWKGRETVRRAHAALHKARLRTVARSGLHKLKCGRSHRML
jgi:uncharacterized protein (TIGR02246 family)